MDYNDENKNEIIDDLIVENLSYNGKELNTNEENKSLNENKKENNKIEKLDKKEIKKDNNKILDEKIKTNEKNQNSNKIKKITKKVIKKINIIPNKSDSNINKTERKNSNKNLSLNLSDIINENININKDKNELIKELLDKEKLLDQLINSNTELKAKIEYSNKKFEEIEETMKNQEKEKINLENQIKEIDKNINTYKSENNNYLTKINDMKAKIELKDKLEKDSGLKNILKSEQSKNKLLKNKLTNIQKINLVQKKYINHLENQYRIKGKITELKSEIDNEKSLIKIYKERFDKIDTFHNRISNEIERIKLALNKLEEMKHRSEDFKKSFTQEELTDTVDTINNLRSLINEKRNDFNNICKSNDDKVFKILSQNLKIENEINENKRMNKLLMFKKNELKRIIKSLLNNNK